MGALSGLRVLEYAQGVAGPFCSKLLAVMGAEVIKVEPPAGDLARFRGPFISRLQPPENSALFLYLNLSKRGITLDLESAEGRARFSELAGRADVVVEDVPPVDRGRLGLDYTALRALSARVIAISITPFGSTGPHRDYRAQELNVFHAGGEGYLLPSGMAWQLFPDRPPVRAGGYLAGYQSGLTAAVGVLAALMGRFRTGRGQWIDMSEQEAQIALDHLPIQRFQDGVLETRATRQHTYNGVVPCKDGYVELLTLEQHQWESQVRMMGSPAWTEEFNDPMVRARRGSALDEHVRAWSMQLTREEICRLGREAGTPVCPYNSPGEATLSEHERARGFFADLPHPELGSVTVPSWPFQFSASPASITGLAPRLGEHNAEILGN